MSKDRVKVIKIGFMGASGTGKTTPFTS